MSAVRQEGTAPELAVRSELHRLGYRFTLRRKDLPGRPDVVLPRHRIAVFVNGCFWHWHSSCSKGTIPKTNKAFWKEKLTKNRARDQKNETKLMTAGYRVLVLWECELEDQLNAARVIKSFFGTL